MLLASGCSREQQDWRSAESADTIEAYGRFIQRHPESELAAQARTRVAQLDEDQDWQHAGSADTVDAYRQFISQHPNGKWAQEARIRIENFSLGEQARSLAMPATGPADAPPARVGFGVQLGAFSTQAGASDEWRVLTGRFGPELQGLQEHVVAVEGVSGRIYRLQAAVGDETRARAICSALRSHGHGCVAVLPN